jgi:hypothetical protein
MVIDAERRYVLPAIANGVLTTTSGVVKQRG